MSEVVRMALAAVVDGGMLTFEQARDAMGSVMDGESTPAQLAALMVALRMRGETVDELAGFATAMRARVLRVDAPAGAIDVVGTGGDRSGTFNISTAAAIVVAAAGVPVAKHGNRAITSASGSSDVLEALGVVVQQSPEEAAESLREDGFAFLFAPGFHPAMKHAGPTRREIGVRTAFNLLGPMTNPAGVTRLVVGAGDAIVAPKMADALQRLGVERAFVVHGEGIDELPLDGSGVRYDVTPGGIARAEIMPESVGLARAPRESLVGGDPAANAVIVEAVLRGADGPRRHVVLLNAGAALELAGRAGSLGEGVALAAATIDSGAAADRLDRLRARRIRVEAAREDAAAHAGAAPASMS
jgi:anthranilate phosphoribosyltransferase